MGTFSIWHWLIVLAVVVLVFGTKKLRNLGSDLGSALKGFKEGMKESGTENSSSQSAHTDDQILEVSAKKEASSDTVKESIKAAQHAPVNTSASPAQAKNPPSEVSAHASKKTGITTGTETTEAFPASVNSQITDAEFKEKSKETQV